MNLGMDLGKIWESPQGIFSLFFFKIRIIFLFFNQYQNKHTVYPNPYPKRAHKLKNVIFQFRRLKISQNRIEIFSNI